MRTTLTLEPDVARLLEAEVHRLRQPLEQVVNQALRRGLTASTGRTSERKRYRVRPHAARLRPVLDPARLNALADELEDATLVGHATRA